MNRKEYTERVRMRKCIMDSCSCRVIKEAINYNNHK